MSTKTLRTPPRTVSREEEPARAPSRGYDEPRLVPEEKRDPTKIYTRSGREIGGIQFTGNEDRFAFDPSIVPEGWTYEWKTKSVKNWEWTEHQVELAANGWEPVPPQRHDGVFLPRGSTLPTIERGGMILMERDERLTKQSRDLDRRNANQQLGDSRSMAGLMERQVAPGSLAIADFHHPDAQRRTGVKIERQARVDEAKYQYDEE